MSGSKPPPGATTQRPADTRAEGAAGEQSIFICDDAERRRFQPTEHARGPWDPRALHGGAPAALIAGELERIEPGAELPIARLYFEFLRPVPLAPLQLSTRITRPGRRVQALEAELRAGEEIVCRARALRILAAPEELPASAAPAAQERDGGAARTDGSAARADDGTARGDDGTARGDDSAARADDSAARAGDSAARPGDSAARPGGAGDRASSARDDDDASATAMLPGPEHARPVRFALDTLDRDSFAATAIEMRFLKGGALGGVPHDRPPILGPADVWMRLRHPLLPGEPPTPLARVAAAADFGNGVSAVLPFDEYLFINADLSIDLDRRPHGEWVGLQSRTLLHPGGIGWAESLLHDERGPLGVDKQTLVVQPR